MRIYVLAPAAFLACAAPLAAQRAAESWTRTVRFEAELRYDDNLFLLRAGRRDRPAEPDPADLVSGRFRDMESATDLILIPAARLQLAGPGAGGRRLELEAEVAYDANLRNGARRHAEVSFQAEQVMRRGGSARLALDWRPAYFHRNYLADAVDTNGDGVIAADERRYLAGSSNEVDLSARVRQRLARRTGDRPFTVTGELEARYFARRYDAPFAGRGRSGPGAGAGVTAEVGPRWVVGLRYAVASLGGDPTTEVVLVDEAAFGQDFNGNGNTSDTSARAVVPVDRSRVEHELWLTGRTDLSPSAVLTLAYGHRIRMFGSEEPFDIVNRDRRDRRHELEAEVDVRLRPGIRLVLGARRTLQTTNRPGDPGSTGDEADYARHVLSAGLRYRL